MIRTHRVAGLAESVQLAALATQITLAIGAIADPGFTTGPRWHKIALDAIVAPVTNERRRQALREVLREHRVECGALALPAGQVAARAVSCAVRLAFTWPKYGRRAAVACNVQIVGFGSGQETAEIVR